MKTLDKTIIGGICCVTFGISEIALAIIDYQYRIYVSRWVDSGCKPGSGCPFPAMNDHLMWLGFAIIITGIFLLTYRRIKQRMKIRK